jgi:hypothetical protein
MPKKVGEPLEETAQVLQSHYVPFVKQLIVGGSRGNAGSLQIPLHEFKRESEETIALYQDHDSIYFNSDARASCLL